MTDEEEAEIPTISASAEASTSLLFTSHPEQGAYLNIISACFCTMCQKVNATIILPITQ